MYTYNSMNALEQKAAKTLKKKSRQQEYFKIKTEITKIETWMTIKRINETNVGSLRKIINIRKLLFKLTEM